MAGQISRGASRYERQMMFCGIHISSKFHVTILTESYFDPKRISPPQYNALNLNPEYKLLTMMPCDLNEKKVNSRPRPSSINSVHMRRSSLRQHGVATRATLDAKREAMERCSSFRMPSEKYLQDPEFEHRREDSESSLQQFRNLNLQPQRTVTPTDLEHGHIGAFKLGSLRITNGAASPTSSRGQPQDDEGDLLSNQVKRYREFHQHSRSLSRDMSKSWDVNRESPLRQTQGSGFQSPETSLRRLNSDLELVNDHTKLVPSANPMSEVREKQRKDFLPEKVTAYSFLESPRVSPVPQHTKFRWTDRDRLSDNGDGGGETWTLMSSDTRELGQNSKPPSKADSGYRSNISSQSPGHELMPSKIQLAQEDESKISRVTSGTVLCTSSISSKENLIRKPAHRKYSSSCLQTNSSREVHRRPQTTLYHKEENVRASVHQENEIYNLSTFSETSACQANAKSSTHGMKYYYENPLGASTSINIPPASPIRNHGLYTPSHVSHLDIPEQIPVKAAYLKSEKIPQTFLFDASPTFISETFESEHPQADLKEGLNTVKQKNLPSPRESRYSLMRMESDKNIMIQPTSNTNISSHTPSISPSSSRNRSTVRQDPVKSPDFKMLDMSRTPSLSSSTTTSTTEAISTPVAQSVICKKLLDNLEFDHPVNIERNMELCPSATFSSAINSADVPRSDKARNFEGASASYFMLPSANPPMPRNYIEPSLSSVRFVNTQLPSPSSQTNPTAQNTDGGGQWSQESPSRSQTPPTPSVPPQSELRVSYRPAPLLRENTPDFPPSSVNPTSPQIFANVRTNRKVSHEKNISRIPVAVGAKFSPVYNPSSGRVHENKARKTDSQTSNIVGTSKMSDSAPITVPDLISKIQAMEDAKSNPPEITLERPIVQQTNTFLERPEVAKSIAPVTREISLESKGPFSNDSRTEESDLSINTRLALPKTTNHSIKSPKIQPNCSEMPAPTSTLKSADVPETMPYHTKESNSDTDTMQECRPRSGSTPNYPEAVKPHVTASASRNSSEVRRPFTPSRYRRPSLSSTVSSLPDALNTATTPPALNREQRTLEESQQTSPLQFANSGSITPLGFLSETNCSQQEDNDSAASPAAVSTGPPVSMKGSHPGPQRQMWRRRSSNASSRLLFPEIDDKSSLQNTARREFPQTSSKSPIEVGLNKDTTSCPSGPTIPKTLSPVLVPDQAPLLFRRNKSSYPPQAHANRRSQVIFSLTTPPPVPKIKDVYLCTEKSPKQMDQILNQPSSPSWISKPKEKKDIILLETLYYPNHQPNLSPSLVSGMTKCILDKKKLGQEESVAQQHRRNSVISVKEQAVSCGSPVYERLSLPESGGHHNYNSKLISGNQVPVKGGESLDLKIEPQPTRQKPEDNILNRGRPVKRAAETALLSLRSEMHLVSKLYANRDMVNNFEQAAENSLGTKSLEVSSTSAIDETGYSQPSTGIIRKSKSQDLNLRSRSLEVRQTSRTQPSIRPKYVRHSSIDSLPSQNTATSRVYGQEQSLLYPHCSLPRTPSSISSGSGPQSRKIVDPSYIYSPLAESRLKAKFSKDIPSPKSSDTETSDVSSVASWKPDRKTSPTSSPRVSSGQTKRSSTILTPNIYLGNDRMEAKETEATADQPSVSKIMPLSQSARELSSIDTLPSQRKKLRLSNSADPTRPVSLTSQKLYRNLNKPLPRIQNPRENESSESYDLVSNTGSFYSLPGQVQTPNNSITKVSTPQSPNRLPTIPLSTNTYYQSSLQRSSIDYPISPNFTHMSYQTTAGSISRSPSVLLSPAVSSFSMYPEERDMVVLAAGWNKRAAYA